MGELVDFALAVEELDDAVVVRVEGELDLAHADTLAEATARFSDASHLVLDLTGCTFLDSSGVRVITAAATTTDRVSLVATDPAVLRILEITAVETLVTIHPSLEAAL